METRDSVIWTDFVRRLNHKEERRKKITVKKIKNYFERIRKKIGLKFYEDANQKASSEIKKNQGIMEIPCRRYYVIQDINNEKEVCFFRIVFELGCSSFLNHRMLSELDSTHCFFVSSYCLN